MLTIRPIKYRDACKYVDEYHRHHNRPQGGIFCLSVYEDDTLHGVAICGRPVSRILDDGKTVEITRVCTDGYKNACSKLYGACCRVAREMGYEKAITYTLQTENGASLKASNFKNEGRAGGTHWTGKRNRGQNIPAEMKQRWSVNL